jgi:hypothetical protein
MSTKTSILDELTKPLPRLSNSGRGRGASARLDYPDIGRWVEWADFNAETLRSRFRGIVDAPWTIRSSLHPKLSRWETQFFDEDDLEHSVITRCIMPPVNAALSHALKCAKLDNAFDIHLGRAARTYEEPDGDRRFKPDWAGCAEHRKLVFPYGFRYANLLPGDSKVSHKWHSSSIGNHLSPADLTLWKDPVRQILQYCNSNSCRYGYLITDLEFVALRVSPMSTEVGSSTTRQSSRPVAETHTRHISTSTTMSQLSASLQGLSVDTDSSYRPGGFADDGYIVEYRSVPWESSGKQHLTIHLGLFYLAWLATVGDNTLQFSYPSFDSCWPLLDGTFIHNTTGLALKKPVKVEHPDPAREAGPRWVDLADGEPTMALDSVRTLDITEYEGRYYYYYIDVDDAVAPQPTLVTNTVRVYDEESQQFGYFDSLVWRFGSPPSEPSASKRQRRK